MQRVIPPRSSSSSTQPPLSYMDTFSQSSFDQDDYDPNRPTTPISMEPSNGVTGEGYRHDDGSFGSPSPRSRSSLVIDNSKIPILRGGGVRGRRGGFRHQTTPPDEVPFQLSESLSRKTIYMVNDVPRPLSNTLNVLSGLSVEESLPASVPMLTPPTISLTPPSVYSSSDPIHLEYVNIESETLQNGSQSRRNGSESGGREETVLRRGTITDVFSNFKLEEFAMLPEEVEADIEQD